MFPHLRIIEDLSQATLAQTLRKLNDDLAAMGKFMTTVTEWANRQALIVSVLL